MRKIRDIFKAPTEAQVKERDEEREKVKESVRETIVSAQKCLQTDAFQEYRRKYQEAYEKLIKLMLAYKDPDPLKFAFAMLEYQCDINAIGSLINAVNFNAQRKNPFKSEEKNG